MIIMQKTSIPYGRQEWLWRKIVGKSGFFGREKRFLSFLYGLTNGLN